MKPLSSSPPPLFWESESRCSCCLPCAVFSMLPPLPWVPKGVEFCVYLLSILKRYKWIPNCPPRLRWAWAALCPRACSSDGRQEGPHGGELQLVICLLNPSEMSRQCSSTAVVVCLREPYQTDDVFGVSAFKNFVRAVRARHSHLMPQVLVLGLGSVICCLSVSRQSRRQLIISFADSSLKAMWMIVP